MINITMTWRPAYMKVPCFETSTSVTEDEVQNFLNNQKLVIPFRDMQGRMLMSTGKDREAMLIELNGKQVMRFFENQKMENSRLWLKIGNPAAYLTDLTDNDLSGQDILVDIKDLSEGKNLVVHLVC